MGLFDDLFGKDEKKRDEAYGLLSFLEDDNNEDDDEELKNLGLEDWQIEEVKKGNCDPWDFEEEEMEEDDYYYEDKD